MSAIVHVISHSLMITLFVFMMMVIIDYVNVLTSGRMEEAVKGGKWRQYTLASFLGSTPGCLGAFMNVSFYAHGLLSFGAIVGGMIATSGDEAFVMLAIFPKKALLLFIILFIVGIIGAWLSDKTISRIGIIPCENCELQIAHAEKNCQCFESTALITFSKLAVVRYIILFVLALSIVAVATGQIGPHTWNWVKITLFLSLTIAICILLTVPDHYLDEHIWKHIIKEHLWRVFLWTFFALLLITVGLKYWNIEAFVKAHLAWVFLICALVGLIPESGPHMVFVMMFANGLVPFSILLTNSIVQDGHGMLPLFSYSLKDALLIKLFNLFLALLVGLPLFLLGW
jgi:hypothetical protein